MSIPITNEIQMFFHCKLCLAEIEDNELSVSPREYVQIEVGWTPLGFQAWCKRHECNICHMDFQGAKHPANCERLPDAPSLSVVTS